MNCGKKPRKLLSSLVVRQRILLYCQTTADQRVCKVKFYVGLATEPYRAAGLLLHEDMTILVNADYLSAISTKLNFFTVITL